MDTESIKQGLLDAIMHFSIESSLYETALRDLSDSQDKAQEILVAFSSAVMGAWDRAKLIDYKIPIIKMLVDITELLDNRRVSISVLGDVLYEHFSIKLDQIPSYIPLKLEIMERHVTQLIERIRTTDDNVHANEYFQALERLQALIAKMVFGEHVRINERLYKFVHDFDRIDDTGIRNIIYKQIKECAWP
jgi:hypothetical protein